MTFEIRKFEDESIWYVPDVQDNREKDEGKEFAVLLEPVSAQVLRRAEEAQGRLVGKKVNYLERYNKIRASVIMDHVLEVVRCSYITIKAGVETRVQITTSKELVKVAPEELLEDIYAALKDHSKLGEGLLGNFNSPSSSSSQEIPTPGNGDVQNAKGGKTATATEKFETAMTNQTTTLRGGGHPNYEDAHGRS